MNVSELLKYTAIAPPCIAELLVKFLVPLKISTALTKLIAPPPVKRPFAELLMKLLVPVNVSIALLVLITPPLSHSTELPMKLLVPMKVSTLSALSYASYVLIAPLRYPVELLMKLLVPLRVSTTLVFILVALCLKFSLSSLYAGSHTVPLK